VRRDEDDGRARAGVGQSAGELEPTLGAERDVDEDDVRLELLCSPQSTVGGRGDANDR
jgi:hypothetical protein